VLFLFAVVNLLSLSAYRGVDSLVVAAALVGALLALQLGYFSRPASHGRLRYVALLIQATLVFAPLLVYGQAWVAMPGFLVGSLVLVLRPRIAVPLAVAVVAIVALVQAGLSGEVRTSCTRARRPSSPGVT
jgi:two-component system sensor histidine kinase DesK